MVKSWYNCLETTQFENRINHLGKSKVDIDNFFCSKGKYETRKYLLSRKYEIKCNNIIKQYKKWFNDVTKKNVKKYNPNWPPISNHSYRILIIGGLQSRKTNLLFNLINQQPDIDKIYLYAKDPYNAKYQLSITKCETAWLRHLNYSKGFIEYSNDTDNLSKNIEEYGSNKKRELSIVFDNMTADMVSNKKLIPIVTELFIRGIKLNISRIYCARKY